MKPVYLISVTLILLKNPLKYECMYTGVRKHLKVCAGKGIKKINENENKH